MSRTAKALKEWMGERSAEVVAPLLGVVPNTVRNWIEGVHRIPKSKLPLVASVTGISVEVLAGRHAPRRTKAGAA